MGDAGSNLLGYLLACIAIQGVLKTAAAVALFFPLVILAVPILDTGFVVAKRLKYGKPIYAADKWHFHHRFVNIGFSQRRTVLYLYAWTLCLAAMALALRFIPYSDGHGNLDTGWTLVLAAAGLLVLAASFYLVVVLEILKLRRFSGRRLRRGGERHGRPGRRGRRRAACDRRLPGDRPRLSSQLRTWAARRAPSRSASCCRCAGACRAGREVEDQVLRLRRDLRRIVVGGSRLRRR